MFFNKQVCLFSNSLDFGFFNLFDGICFSIFFGSCLKDFREVPRSQMNEFSKLIKTVECILRLRFCCYGNLCCSFLSFRIAVLFRLWAIDLVRGPMFLLTVDSAIINFFAPGTSQKLFIGLVACLTLLKDFYFSWLVSWEVWCLNLFHLNDYNLKNLK